MAEKVACRKAYGEELAKLGEEFDDLVVLDADISSSTQTIYFSKKFPERHFNFGVAEQNMIGVAAGMTMSGKISIASTYAVFASMRACEQIRTYIAYPKLNVKIMVTHGGIEVGWDGVSHQGTEDIAIIRSMPNMTIVVPADAVSTRKLLRKVIQYEGPVYFRMGRNPVPLVYDEKQSFEIGRTIELRRGKDVAILAIGVMVVKAIEAANALKKDGIDATVLDLHTVKPMDSQALVKAAKRTGCVVTAEDHQIHGGMGSAVAEILGESCPVPMERVGLKNTFGESGSPEELFKKYGLTADRISSAVKNVLKRKG